MESAVMHISAPVSSELENFAFPPPSSPLPIPLIFLVIYYYCLIKSISISIEYFDFLLLLLQSRRDRDKYIRVVNGNIAPGALENFDKIDVENITSLGFAYDFDSVMHYDALAFTMNGAPTLKVRKEYRDVPSTELGMKERLSDIDIAQVNAMYECNQKKPQPEGW